MINDVLPNPPPGVRISLFADDIVIWFSSSSLLTCFTNLQLALNSLQSWSDHWGFRFSSAKTKAIIFVKPSTATKARYRAHAHILTMKDQVIELVTHHRYLGLIFDRSLSWNKHITELASSMTCKVNILKALSGLSWGADRNTLLMLFRNMVRPKMTYGCVLFSSTNDNTLKPLVTIQNKCLKIATGAVYCTRTTNLEVEACTYPLRLYCDRMVLLTAAAIRNTHSHPLNQILTDFNRFIGYSHLPFGTRAHLAAL